MIRFGLFNSINGDRKYKAEEFSEYFATFIGNGIFVKPSDCLQVLAKGNSMKIIIRPGKAWIDGRYIVNTEDYEYTLSPGDASLNRIDRIVVRCDYIDRKMSVSVKKGTLSASPVAPTLKRDADAYELALADIYIAKGALTITQASITDTRLNNNLCGYMHNPIYQVDTTSIFNQYQSWFNNYSVTKAAEFAKWQKDVTTALEAWIDGQEADFEAWMNKEQGLFLAWFETIKGILNEDAAGNLYNMIDDHEKARRPHIVTDVSTGKKYETGWVLDGGKLFFEYLEVK